MSNEFKIYTKTGDDGTTGLFGGSRVKKYDNRLEAYGTVDELNAYLGMIRSFSLEEPVAGLILFIQEKLFTIGAKLASDERGRQYTEKTGCTDEDIRRLETAIDQFEEKLPKLRNFIIPGGNQAVSFCHIARTVCRRAERNIVRLFDEGIIPKSEVVFINRLSDFLFVLSRKLAHDGHFKETYWTAK